MYSITKTNVFNDFVFIAHVFAHCTKLQCVYSSYGIFSITIIKLSAINTVKIFTSFKENFGGFFFRCSVGKGYHCNFVTS